MKKILFLALVAILFGCKSKDNEPAKPFSIKATDMISIKPASGVKLKVKSQSDSTIVDTIHLSALEIVKQSLGISFIHVADNSVWSRTFIKAQRDTISTTPKLLMWATDVIGADDALQIAGTLIPDWIEATDVVFQRVLQAGVRDTIAYIPNSTLRTAETSIRTAYANKDIETCYSIFNSAYTFIPITGAEWRVLKAKNQQ